MTPRVDWSHLDLCSATKVCDCVATPQISVNSDTHTSLVSKSTFSMGVNTSDSY